MGWGEEKMVPEKLWVHLQNHKAAHPHTDGAYWLFWGGGFTSAKCMFQRDGGMFRGDTETDRYALNLRRDFRNR